MHLGVWGEWVVGLKSTPLPGIYMICFIRMLHSFLSINMLLNVFIFFWIWAYSLDISIIKILYFQQRHMLDICICCKFFLNRKIDEMRLFNNWISIENINETILIIIMNIITIDLSEEQENLPINQSKLTPNPQP